MKYKIYEITNDLLPSELVGTIESDKEAKDIMREIHQIYNEPNVNYVVEWKDKYGEHKEIRFGTLSVSK